jgi:hypothetical protein
MNDDDCIVFDVKDDLVTNVASMLSSRDNDNELLSLTCINDVDCNIVDLDEARIEDIANMLMERPPTLRL